MNCVSRSQPSSVTSDEVLDPHARSLVRQVDPGLDGDDVPRLEHVRRLRAQRGRLVDLESDAVSHPVTVGPAETGRLDQRARGGVGVAPVDPGSDCGETGELGLEAERVELRQPLGHFADREGARAVRAVAVDDAPGIDERRARPPRSARRPGTACGDAAVAAGADDRLERDALRPGLAEAPLDPPRELSSRCDRVKRSFASASKISSESALARRIVAISSSSLTARSALDESRRRHCASTPASTSAR